MAVRLLLCSGSLEGGGSERQLWQLANGLDGVRFLPCIYLLYRRGVYLDKLADSVPVEDFWSHHPSAQELAVWRRIPGKIHRQQVEHLGSVITRRKIDVLYDRTFHMTLVTAPSCRRTAIPRVSAIVSPPSQDFSHSRERFKFLKKWLLARAYRDPMSTTVAVSADVAADASQFYGIERERILVIPSPIDVAAVESAASVPGFQRDSDLHFAVVGRLSSEKGQAVALDALAEFLKRSPLSKTVKLEVVGDGPDRQQLEIHAERLGVSHAVRFHGYLDNPYPVIQQSDVLLIPSYYEGLPNVALEAMALDTPVVATRCSGALHELFCGEANSESRGRLVEVGNARQFSDQLVNFCESPESWATISRKASEFVRKNHGLEPWLRRMEQLFRDCIQRRYGQKNGRIDGEEEEW